MGKIYCLMGKSAAGKDTLYKMLMDDRELGLKNVVPYTTRPRRSEEREGVEYHFCDKESFKKMKDEQKVVEYRCYNTCYGEWIYFTADDGTVQLKDGDYLIIGTLEAYDGISKYYGEDNVIPLYVSLDDGVRLERALKRERSQANPKYNEMCRRFLADDEDFSEEKLASLGIKEYYDNFDLNSCYEQIKRKIWTLR